MAVDGKYRMNMCEGPLFSKVVRFSVPLFLSLFLQLMFSAADLIVVGRYASSIAQAAVGSSSALTTLAINIFVGLSVGTNVLAANYYGGEDDVRLAQTTHTAMLTAILSGLFVGFFGYVYSWEMLELMSTPEEVMEKAVLYLQIYFVGTPFLLIYNFGSAILRAIGDTKRPLYYLVLAGIINVILNLIFVLRFGMDADGVAWATVISQGVSAVLVWYALATADDACKLQFRKLGIHPVIMKKMLAIGVPAGAQGACFSISNVLIQRSINTFGALCMAGNAATLNLEGMVYVGSYCCQQSVLSFVGQNLGSKNFERIRKSIWYCLYLAVGVTAVTGIGTYIFAEPLLGIYNHDPDAIVWGIRRMKVSFTFFWLCGIMDVWSGALRGLGRSLSAAIMTLVGVCAMRIVWIYTVFEWNRTMETLMLSYPISWLLVDVGLGFYLYRQLNRMERLELRAKA